MEFKDYYEVLGVSEDAGADEIKRAYRKMARKYHPDVSSASDAEARFKEVNEAYEALKDPEKRQAYDEARRSPFHQGGSFQPPPDWRFDAGFRGGGFTEADAGQFSDFFRVLFGAEEAAGAHAAHRRPHFSGRGEDVHERLQVTLPEAYAGARRTLTLNIPQVGAEGQLTNRQRTLHVKVPAGVAPGQRVRLRGQGGAGAGKGPAGDLYLEISIAPHPLFAIDGRDLTLTLPVAPWEAALGASVPAPTLGGPVTLKIPPRSQAGARLRLRGRGLPGKPPGDQFVILSIATPPADTAEQTDLYRRMADSFQFDPRAALKAEMENG